MRARRASLAAAAALAILCLWPAAAGAAGPALRFSSPASFDAGGDPTAVSCASESLCVAVDSRGEAWTSTDPGSPTPSWSGASIDGTPLRAVSCAPDGPCVAVDSHGDAFVNAESGSSSWTQTSIDGETELTGVSCPSASLCVGVDAKGDVLTTSAPLSGHWSAPASLDAEAALTGVACSSTSLCVAVAEDGEAISSSQPLLGAAGWRARALDIAPLTAVSCDGGQCVAVDSAGDALASSDPGAQSATWSLTPIDATGLTGVSCSAVGLCAAVDGGGSALATDTPQASPPGWTASTGLSGALKGISCLPSGLCVTVDSSGRSAAGLPPAPAVTTLPARAVSPTSALLAGSVSPEGASLTACSLEYGTSLPYTASAPCTPEPTAAGGAQEATASVSDLAPNATYHYRLLAASAAGVAAGLDQTFATPPSPDVPLVAPHPSITGTPAPGQTLTCHSGVEAGSSATLAYAWLRDLVPIAGSTHSTYQVKGQDSGHHLQCQVTATDGGGSASAKSAFVTVPMGGVPASVGETSIGLASFRANRVRVPVSCAPHASGSCELTVRVSHAAATLAYARSQVDAGASATVSVRLSSPGRRLLARLHRLSASLQVSGTVVGVIRAQLSTQSLTLNASGSSSHASAVALREPSPSPSWSAAAARVLAATPYMGWDTYFALGGRYSEATVLEEASKLITLGLRRRGYRYVWLDVGWWHGAREADGQIEVSPVQWPHGLRWLTATLHAAGFLVGLYTDAGPNGCGGAGQGSYGHYQQDANTFAAWGFDAVKVDFCGGFEHGLEPAAAYSAFHQAILANSSHRPMLLSICNFTTPEQQGEGEPTLAGSSFASYSFGPSVGNSWRTDTDVGTPGDVPFADVLRNLDADAANPQAAGPGHWNDPDYLAPDQGMNAVQFRTQLSMWSMLAAPLMVSDDLRKIGRSSLQALQDTQVTAIDQDPAGVQGRLVAAAGSGEVWVKPLSDGSRAVALLNRGSSALRISTSAAAVGMPGARAYTVRNLWSHAVSSTSGGLGAEVGPDATVLLRVYTG